MVMEVGQLGMSAQEQGRCQPDTLLKRCLWPLREDTV